MGTPEIAICSIIGYILISTFVVGIFYEDYIEDKITRFEGVVLSIFWPITLPYKFIKTLIIAIRKI